MTWPEQMGTRNSMMQAVVEDLRSGQIEVCDIPVPDLARGGILVRTAFSAISAGTERASLEVAEKSLIGKAIARPDLVKQVLDFARRNGVRAAYDKVRAKLGNLSTMGYSCSGTVVAVGEGVNDFQYGERVACAGAGYANHCEVNWIPRNLAVHVPDAVAQDAACLTTIGAIAMQGLRQAQVSVGETVLVIGAGLIGVLTAQLARVAGCRVMATDPDPARVAWAAEMGAHRALLSSDPDLPRAVLEFSRYGADACIVSAASASAEPLELAAKVLRDRGRIVVVGAVGMGVSRSPMYQREATLAMSRSYGPGRYDPSYEEGGNDYPVGYVRWTERRNMEAFLDLLATGALELSPLLCHRYPVHEAARAYQELMSGNHYTAILDYAQCEERRKTRPAAVSPGTKRAKAARLRVGCLGAGSFAQSHIFPALKHVGLASMEVVATASGVTAESARRNFGFSRVATPSELLCDSGVDAVFITTRHQSHAGYVEQALRHGKSVFVEKPLAVNRDQLESLRQVYQEMSLNGEPFLMVGFNRRFAPATRKIREFFAHRREPMMVHVRVNAGFLPAEHWVQQATEGGRVVGECCHFVDWARHLIGEPLRSITVAGLPNGTRYRGDNVSATLTFVDGSIAHVLYLANGDSAIPKEYFEVFCEGAVARLDDFASLELVRNRRSVRQKLRRDKGHEEEIRLTLEAMSAGRNSLIPVEEIFEITEATLTIAEMLSGPTATHDIAAARVTAGLQVPSRVPGNP